MSSSALSLGYGHLEAQKTKCHNKTCAFEQHRSSRAPPRPQTASLKTRGKLKEEEVESVKQKSGSTRSSLYDSKKP